MFLLEEVRKLDRTSRWNYTFQVLNLQTRTNVEDFTLHAAKQPEHRNLNRYRDVLPYDHSRVKLENGLNDYINANTIEASEVGRKYILTQGPLPDTCSHFWQMVWEQDSSAVIMLNKIIEKNTVKCHPYWPMGEDEEIEYSDFRVKNLSERSASAYVVRDLLLEQISSGNTKEIKQFHYMLWPDFGVPSRPETFLNFLYDIRDSDVFNPKYGPPVIHCSAGICRSGTFCLVDCILQKAEIEGTPDNINVKEMLLKLRNYRVGLVQTPEQLRFSYLAIIQGIANLFPDSFKEEETEDSHKRKADDLEPPPIPPRKRLPPEKPPRSPQNPETTAEQETLKQKKMVKQLQGGSVDESSEEESGEDEVLDLSASESDIEEAEDAKETNEISESEEEDHLVDVGSISRAAERTHRTYSPIDETFPINKPLPPLPGEDGIKGSEQAPEETSKENNKQNGSFAPEDRTSIENTQHESTDFVEKKQEDSSQEISKQEIGYRKLLPVFPVEEEDEDLRSTMDRSGNSERNSMKQREEDVKVSDSKNERTSDVAYQSIVEDRNISQNEYKIEETPHANLPTSTEPVTDKNVLCDNHSLVQDGIAASKEANDNSDLIKKKKDLITESTKEHLGDKARDEVELRQRQRRDQKNKETADMVQKIKQKMREQELTAARWAFTKKSLIALGVTGALMFVYYCISG